MMKCDGKVCKKERKEKEQKIDWHEKSSKSAADDSALWTLVDRN